jgi:hypothetical protein
VAISWILIIGLGVAQSLASLQAAEVFVGDFESGLAGWEISDPNAIRIVDSDDPSHGKVLHLAPAHARLHALIRGSEDWAGYRIEGQVLFPNDVHNYLGFIYNYSERGQRADLGSIYIKGNGSYIRVNPRRDWNPARMLYEEFRTALTGPDAIRIGEWQRFAAEVIGTTCHFYVGDMVTPKVTFDLYEFSDGKVGFKPRVVGGPVLLDDVRATAIRELSYEGPGRPSGIDHRPDLLVTTWELMGPLSRADAGLEQAADPLARTVLDRGTTHEWSDFRTDARGAVVTGRVVDFHGNRTVAYFLTEVEVPDGESARLEFSSIDDLAIWVNGRFKGYAYRDALAWHDFGRNPDHRSTAAVALSTGPNRVLVRVRGGVYASGGFFARVARASR